jgi:hypothetical protein
MVEKTDMLYADTMKKNATYMIMIPMILVLSGNAFSQNGDKSMYFWRFNSVSGQVGLIGRYREEYRVVSDINDSKQSYYLTGGIELKTNSSVLNPNFLVLDIDGAYMPETNRQNYIVTPDQAEIRTVKKISLGASFFQQKDITLNLFADYNESYSTRENLTDIKSINKHWGALFGYNNRYLPFTLDFHSRKWDETEIQTGRRYSMDQKLFEARTIKSFTKRDRSEFSYSHDYNLNLNQNMFRVENTIDNIEFISHVKLDTKEKYNLNTVISNLNQYGFTNLKRFQASAFTYLQLPKHLAFYGNYNYFNIRQASGELVQNGINTSLEHKLFNSLKTRINFDYNNIKQTVYKEVNTKSGFELDYSKRIPGGQLLINYEFSRFHQNYQSDPSAINISNEQYTLSDNKIDLLRLPDINIESVVVKDLTGTLIYENGFDYILIARGRFTEIRRIPGGKIANNSVVLIDYTAIQPGSYKFDANTHIFNTSVYLLKNMLSVYYRFSTQNYSNLESTQLITLNYFTQNLAGCRLDFGFINVGAEYENYKSSILPYHMMRYYVNIQKNIGKNLMLMLNGNMQNYVMLDKPEPEHQDYMDMTGKVIYTIYKQTSLNVDLMYRKQTGQNIDLNLFTARSEITSQINLLYLTLGVELYKRDYVGEVINFKGTYVKIVRKF